MISKGIALIKDIWQWKIMLPNRNTHDTLSHLKLSGTLAEISETWMDKQWLTCIQFWEDDWKTIAEFPSYIMYNLGVGTVFQWLEWLPGDKWYKWNFFSFHVTQADFRVVIFNPTLRSFLCTWRLLSFVIWHNIPEEIAVSTVRVEGYRAWKQMNSNAKNRGHSG
jgi:hypothetical protein